MSNKKEEVKEKKYLAYSWHKNEDNTYTIVTIEYTANGEASVVDQKNTGLKGRAMLDLTKLLVKARLININ